MARVIMTESAATDETTILNDLYIRAGLRTVIKFRSLFAALYNRVADFPAIGPPRPALGPNVRIGIVAPYLVIYRYSESDDTVTVLRIVHGRRRLAGVLLEGC